MLGSFLGLRSFIWNSAASIGRVFIGVSFHLNLQSPQNITYNFSKEDVLAVDLNVSSRRESLVSNWWYDLKDLGHDVFLNQTVFFSPNQTIIVSRGSNQLTVYSNETTGSIINASVVFFISVPGSAPEISPIDPQIYVCEGNYLSYKFNVTDIDEESLDVNIYPQYEIFYIALSYSVNSTTNTYEIFSGTLSKASAGGINAGSKTYSINITAKDSDYSDNAYSNIIIIEINHAPAIQTIGVQTIWGRGDDMTFNKQVQVTDIESGNQNSGNLTFEINFSNNENLFNILENGSMNFTGNLTVLGIYNISICVTDQSLENPSANISLCGQDGSALKTCQNFSLTITDENRAPGITSYYPLDLDPSINGTDNLLFNITKHDPDGTIPDTYWYVDNRFREYDSGSLNDEFSYNFGCGVSGNHTISVNITDGALNNSMQWNLNVSNIACAVPSTPKESGGGGGGGGCIEKWGCDSWDVCLNLKKSTILGLEEKENITKKCNLFKWGEEFCGFQYKICKDFNGCNTTYKKPLEIQECYYTEHPSCEDGVKNCHDGGCEVLIDCGGPCASCPTCSDKIQNQGEEGLDCGGPCASCRIETPARKLPMWIYLIIIAILIILSVMFSVLKAIRVSRLKKEVKKYKTKRFK